MSEQDKLDKEEKDTAELVKLLEEEREKTQNYLASWQRIQADFTNCRRRMEQEKGEIGLHTRSDVVLKLLPILDDLQRALEAVPPRFAKQSWVKGVRLIEQKFRNILKEQGVTELNVLGVTFDPQLHEATMSHNGEEGKVVKELSKGYKIGGRIIRPAQVAVGDGTETMQKEVEENSSTSY